MVSMAQPIPIPNQTSQLNASNYGFMNGNKKLKRKRVTWAPDSELRQVRFFCIDDSPSVAGLKENRTNRPETSKPADFPDLPPGFESPDDGKRKLFRGAPLNFSSVVVQIPWRTPGLITLDPNWQVVAGGGSEEVLTQQEREKRSFEAFYPNLSNIPENPSDPLEPQDEVDDRLTPIIPTIPIEEEELGSSTSSNVPLSTSARQTSIPLSTSSSSPASSSSSTPSVPSQTRLSDPSRYTEDPNSSFSEKKSGLSVIRENGSIDTSVLQNILSHDSELIKAANKFKALKRSEFVPPPGDKPSPLNPNSLVVPHPTGALPSNHPKYSQHQDHRMEDPPGVPSMPSPFFRPPFSSHPPFPPNVVHPLPPVSPLPLLPTHPAQFPERGFKSREKSFEESHHLSQDGFFGGVDMKMRNARNPPYPPSHPPFSHPHNLPNSNPLLYEGETSGMNLPIDPVHETVNSRNPSKKMCAFFNSSRGCRNGNNCPYVHDAGEGKSSKKRDRNMFDK